LTSHNGQVIPKEEFEKWLDKIKPDWCIFMEYNQWFKTDYDKVQICKDRGIKTIGWLVYERLDWTKKDHYKLYTKIACPTGFQTKLMRKHGIYNAVHTPWGIDFKELDSVKEPKRTNKTVFYHCAGSGGVGDRKNTNTVIEAYKQIEGPDTELRISHLNSRVFSREEIIAFTKYADVILNPSKWDTIGLNTMEACACGRPVIVANTKPMTELIKDNVNGLLVNGTIGKCEHVTCPSYEVDVSELAKKMTYCKSKLILDTLKRNARKFAKENFDWEINKEQFLKILDTEV